MKISDIEYQADGQKINFYYLANKGVDFRELIKILAKEFELGKWFKLESTRISKNRRCWNCGRELCCSTWIKDLEL